ncbi:delta 1-pyrroline-5-carboxylate synthetase [Candidatus Bathyarchaeota archaeon]|nr:MAG: delta 1-pyrroline-5-carboxylate synthetase [Candidatus Bathyarchaeota archaeon]
MVAVIKVGGSLAEDSASLITLCQKLGTLAKFYRMLIVPGGGKFADVVREFYRNFDVSETVAHKMAILSMDQFGMFLSGITPNSQTAYGLEEARSLSSTGILPIILPSKLMFQKDPLKHSWNVTSDSIAAYIAGLLLAKKLILVTDVDGIFTEDPKKDLNAKMIKKLSVNELLDWNKRTSVDKFLPRMLLKIRIDCYVVNGKHPERIKAILEDKKTICTQIII